MNLICATARGPFGFLKQVWHSGRIFPRIPETYSGFLRPKGGMLLCEFGLVLKVPRKFAGAACLAMLWVLVRGAAEISLCRRIAAIEGHLIKQK